MSKEKARSIACDLALTIGVHPMCLGIIPDSSGSIALPPSVRIKYTLVKHLQKGEEIEKNMKANSTVNIEPLIKNLTVEIEGSSPTAVLVTEHENLKRVLTEHESAPGNVILVMSQGYPTKATREFLHMLSLDPALRRTPFLYTSDHDLQGLQIFQALKYGCNSSAESNHIMVCSKLQWAGPTKRELLASPQDYFSREEAQWRADHPGQTPDQIEMRMTAWRTEQQAKIGKQFQKLSKVDQRLLRAIKRVGWLAYEPEIEQEIEQMESEAGKFRFADLAQVDVRYIRTFLQQKISAWSTATMSEAQQAEPLVQRSPTSLRYRAVESQVASSQPLPPPEVTEEEAQELLEEDLI